MPSVVPGQRVGVEVEFGGVALADAVAVFAEWLNAEPNWRSDYEVTIPSAAHEWDFRLEVDWELLKSLARTQEADPDPIRRNALELLESIGVPFVPLELVTPPLRRAELESLAAPLSSLAGLGAGGTQSSLLAAYGTHFNPEVAELRVANILPQLQAFVCLQHWIVAVEQIDPSRRLSQYAALFDRAYEERILAPDYAPVMSTLIDDYLRFNPTRNRALDMLPLFAQIDEPRVRAAVDDSRVQARPTFHYRLADCRLGEPDWFITTPWRSWLAVEALAGHGELLAVLMQQRRDYLNSSILFSSSAEWVAQCQTSIDRLELA